VAGSFLSVLLIGEQAFSMTATDKKVNIFFIDISVYDE